MKTLVCVKQVPGTTQVEVDPETGVLKRDGVAAKLNPYDLYALEAALCLGGSVHTLTMGPPQAKDTLLETIYMGAEAATLVTDRRFAGADVLATAYTLSQAIRSAGAFDIIFCGKQTTDGDTAQVGAEVAELLGLPHAANVLEITGTTGESVTVRVGQEQTVATLRLPLPCLLCMEGGVNTPRLPSYKRKKALAHAPVTTLTLDDFADRNETRYGLAGSPTQVERIFPPEKNTGRQLLRGEAEQLAQNLAAMLRDKKLV